MADAEHRPGEASAVHDLPEADTETPFTPVGETGAAIVLEKSLDTLETSIVPEELFFAQVDLAFAYEQQNNFEETQRALLN